jgi:hypothetical protein
MEPIEFPPGCTNLAARTAKTANWRESNLMRWDESSTMLPVGGWEKVNYTTFTDKIRKIHKWSDNTGQIYTAYLCESHCYVDINGVLSDITPTGGMATPTGNNGGYGDLTYNYSTYGTARPGESRLRAYTPAYSMDNWGEELRVMTSADGRLLAWKPTTPSVKLVAVTGAPVSNRSFVVTPERHIMLFGMSGKFDTFGWCDAENDTNWAFTDPLSRAGFLDIQPKAPIVAHQQFEGGTVMFTPSSAYLVYPVGLPFVYAFKFLGFAPAPLSPASCAAIPQGVVWPSVDGFWIYDGSLPRVAPCAIWDFVTKYVDVSNTRFMGVAVHLLNKGELWWFFVSKELGTQNSRFIFYDYRSDIWGMGKLARTCGMVYANDRFPLMSDGFNIWKHETGFKYPGAEMPWIESMNLTPNGGENWMTIKKLLPEITGDKTAIEFSVSKANSRTDATEERYSSPRRKVNEYGWVDIRETARDMRLRIDMVKEASWGTLGPVLFDTKIRGKK